MPLVNFGLGVQEQEHLTLAPPDTPVSMTFHGTEVTSMPDTVTWLTHEFTVYNYGATWNEVAGIYIFAGINSAGRWQALYIGQCDAFCNRVPNHEQWSAALRLGATHVHARVVSQAATRDALEQQLIQACDPPLNTHHRP